MRNISQKTKKVFKINIKDPHINPLLNRLKELGYCISIRKGKHPVGFYVNRNKKTVGWIRLHHTFDNHVAHETTAYRLLQLLKFSSIPHHPESETEKPKYIAISYIRNKVVKFVGRISDTPEEAWDHGKHYFSVRDTIIYKLTAHSKVEVKTVTTLKPL